MQEIVRCLNCREVVPLFANTCPHCGRYLSDKTRVIQCRYCGKFILKSDVKCRYCDKYQTPQSMDEFNRLESQRVEEIRVIPFYHRWWFILLCTIVAILIVSFR